ncbi:NAD-dependent epimerase/dehydratase family protein [Bacillus sp. ISL-51]|uniref:NAD-dependent epimerase/dehydratase family protein n=1 Tax=Bacteria TaxID=2 RepID=UPI001BECB997|nr:MULTISPECIES: NAD-dependent epimerase/dehydratase family protein [Bacteria]MBT2572732.1 NAD-dependent epimerase/dehydratase family protein [Bacillus sp. ISL-51]MBT2635543.1 NAD-dependent epimerase/dehydratase family protein [Bacillus sp. ISL-26]MBT2713202.1 NAD-dependent epimerase/dehydratase family protein [Pseudomonas sp. ISL-88]
MKHIAIIGGAGFIGSELAALLQSKGYQTIIADQKKPDFDTAYRHTNILDRQSLRESLRGADAVVHLAAMVGVDSCRSNEEDVIRVNFEGTKNVTEICRELGIDTLLFSSSSEVFGDSPDFPYTETSRKLPKSAYGKAKLQSEEYLRDQASDGLDVRVVRYFNVYGPRQREDFVINKFFSLAENGCELPLYGDGGQIRCFSYISDIVTGTYLALIHKGDVFEDFNIGNDQPITIKELAEKVNQISGRNKENYMFKKLGEDGVRGKDIEIFKRAPSIEKAKRLLGYAPKVGLDEGLRIIKDERQKHKLPLS